MEASFKYGKLKQHVSNGEGLFIDVDGFKELFIKNIEESGLYYIEIKKKPRSNDLTIVVTFAENGHPYTLNIERKAKKKKRKNENKDPSEKVIYLSEIFKSEVN